jgi:predicted phosphohydrolase
MKLVLISDTHEHRPAVPDGDVLIHAGDLTMNGKLSYLIEELDWMKSLPHKHKILISGNHDWGFQHLMTQGREDLAHDLAAPMIYLRDSEVVIDGVKFYGSPWQPWFYDWAFNLQRGAEIGAKWDLIPIDTDVLITHGPPKHILDWVGKDSVGCEELATVVNRIAPSIHVFGHIHGAYGRREYGMTKYYNASMVNEAYQLDSKHKPWEVEL